MINKSIILNLIFIALVIYSVGMLYKNHVINGSFYVFTNEETVPSVSLFNKEQMLSLVDGSVFEEDGIYLWNN